MAYKASRFLRTVLVARSTHLKRAQPRISLRMVSTPPAAASTQNVSLPSIPELYDPNFLDVLLPPSSPKMDLDDTTSPAAKNPMIDALLATAHHTRTTNNSPAFSSTLSATLDAFQGMSQASSGLQANRYLPKAWDEDPELTLRIIWNMRSIHDGKSHKESFYRAFGWLYDNHPRTAILNLHMLVNPVCTRPKSSLGASHGYWKDLLNILVLAVLDQLSPKGAHPMYLRRPTQEFRYRFSRAVVKDPSPEARLARIEAAFEASMVQKAQAKQARAVAAAASHEVLLRKLAEPKFRALYIAVARLFAEQLVKDLNVLKELQDLPLGSDRIPLLKQISLAAKWAPTPQASHDRHTNISTTLSLLLHHSQASIPLTFPSIPVEDPLAPHVLRSFYQRWVLSRLRNVTLIPEPLMSNNRWTEIAYNRVSSVCMKNNTETFIKHDPEGFEKYLVAVESGKKKISGATLLPHELVAQVVAASAHKHSDKMPALRAVKNQMDEAHVRVAEAQWNTLVSRLREAGTFDNSLAICDVSGSMGSISSKYCKHNVVPIFPAVALSLVLAQLAKPPFQNGFITFSSRPEFVSLDPSKGLLDTVLHMARSAWEMNTNFNAVFLRLLLPLAIKHNVKQEDMIKRLFVFSDMQFDQGIADSSGTGTQPWETNHDTIEKAFKAAGYELPEIVYWNLSAFTSVPVTGERRGVALMNGFSPGMLKVFMGEMDEETVGEESTNVGSEKELEEFNPINVMKKALMKKSFDWLVVVD